MNNESAISANQAITQDPEVFRRAAANMAAVIDALGESINGPAINTLVTDLLNNLGFDGNSVCEVLKERYSARLSKPGAQFEPNYAAAQQGFANLAAWATQEKATFRAKTLNVPADVELVARQRVKAAADSAQAVTELAEALLAGDANQLLAASRVASEMLAQPHPGMAYAAMADFVHQSRPQTVQAAYAITANIEEARKDSVFMSEAIESHRREAILRDQRIKEREEAFANSAEELRVRNASRGLY